MHFLLDKKFLWFTIKFLLFFAVLYFGTLAIIGMAAPGGGYYNSFVDKYLDYISVIKNLLLCCSKASLSLFGIATQKGPNYSLYIVKGQGVRIAMNCVGYGVYSFWIAYILANEIPIKNKLGWLVGGVLLLFIINDIRISLLLVAINKGWPMPLGIDHHAWFNIFAYLAIFTMIYFFNKKTIHPATTSNES